MKKIKYTLLSLSVFTPFISFAALGGLKNLIKEIGGLVKSIIPIMFGLALIYFFWGLIQFIRSSDDKDREAGKQRMLWGIVALFVFVSIGGILSWLGGTLGIDQGGVMDFITGSGYSGSGGTGGACIGGTNPVTGEPCN